MTDGEDEHPDDTAECETVSEFHARAREVMEADRAVLDALDE